ncbi:prolipoprotein diacylglyceryl transferase [Candidatus Shapirobacteria bacterium]|nr:prolipoprotein diacylglyceryl transferase [Candidatus Shapirobacteria bacterium]
MSLNLPLISFPIFGLVLFLGFFVASFWFFKNTKEEFVDEEQAISFIFWVFLSWLLCGRFFFFITNLKSFPSFWALFLPWQHPGLSFAGGILGMALAAKIWAKKNKFNLWRISDPALFPLLFFQELFSLGQFLSTQQNFYFFVFLILLLGSPLGIFIKKKYRSFSWYPSGKIGLTFLAVLAFVLISFSILAFCHPLRLYFEGLGTLLIGGVAIWLIYQRRQP